MTEKSTKSGKSSLFSKLLAMLEKNAEASGKGKGLHVDKSDKAKGLAGLTEKTDFAVTEKSKSLLGKVSKDKSEIIDKTDETATPLFAAHVIVDTTEQTKKGDHIGKASVLIGGQVAGQDAGKEGSKGAEPGGQKGAEEGVELGFQKGSEQTADKVSLNKPAEKSDSGNIVFNQKVNLASNEGDDLLPGQFKGESSKQGQALETDSARLVSSKPVVEATTPLQKGSGAEQAVKSTTGANPTQFEALLNSGQATEKRSDASTASRFVVEGKKVGTAAKESHALGEKSAVKVSAEAMSAAAGAQFQQAKALQSQQSQQVASAAMGVSVSQTGLAEASLGDSGSQFSDNKGGQGAQSLNTMLGDVKSTSSSSSANFQSYLTSKAPPPPTMSIFDSMNHIAQSAKNGQTRLEIQLDPANLGKIQISLQSDASKQLQIHMVVDQNMTRTALEQQLPQLRNALAQQGFDLSGFSMDSQGQQGQQASSGGDGNGSKSNGLADHSELKMTESQHMQSQQAKTGSGLSIRV